MPNVTCPSCSTRQPVSAEASGYTCAECGVAWRFVTCASCGSRFHARSHARSFVCPQCGTEQDLDVPIRPRLSLFKGWPPVARSILIGYLLVGLVALLIASAVVFALTRGGGTPTPSHTTSADPVNALCAHILDMQVLRVDAIGGYIDTLKKDEQALKEAGSGAAATNVSDLIAAFREYRHALANQLDTTNANQKVGEAIGGLPC